MWSRKSNWIVYMHVVYKYAKNLTRIAFLRRQKQELQKHVFNAHSDEVLRCKYEKCEVTVNTWGAMNRHVNKIHKPDKYR